MEVEMTVEEALDLAGQINLDLVENFDAPDLLVEYCKLMGYALTLSAKKGWVVFHDGIEIAATI